MNTPFANAVSEARGRDVSVNIRKGGGIRAGTGSPCNRDVDGVAVPVFKPPGYTASTTPFLAACKAAAGNGQDEWSGIPDHALTSFAVVEGKELITLSGEEAALFNAVSAAASEIILAEAEAKGVPARAILESLKAE